MEKVYIVEEFDGTGCIGSSSSSQPTKVKAVIDTAIAKIRFLNFIFYPFMNYWNKLLNEQML